MIYDLTTEKIALYRERYSTDTRTAIQALLKVRLAEINELKEARIFSWIKGRSMKLAKRENGGNYFIKFQFFQEHFCNYWLRYRNGTTKQYKSVWHALHTAEVWAHYAWICERRSNLLRLEREKNFAIHEGDLAKDYDFEIEELLASFPEEVRIFVRLKVEGYSMDAIAEKLGVSEHCVEQMREKARRFLKGEE